jgi:hypothetical protein
MERHTSITTIVPVVDAQRFDGGVGQAVLGCDGEELLEHQGHGDGGQDHREEHQGADQRGCLAQHEHVQQGEQVPAEHLGDADHDPVLEGEPERLVGLRVVPQLGEVAEPVEGEALDDVAGEEGVAQGPAHRHQHHQRVHEQRRTQQDGDGAAVSQN